MGARKEAGRSSDKESDLYNAPGRADSSKLASYRLKTPRPAISAAPRSTSAPRATGEPPGPLFAPDSNVRLMSLAYTVV
jgi:hypothetical protein